jgi:hypothetical protein
MSWKSLVTAGLFCVLASPVFAAPGVKVTSAGLDSQGRFLWNVQVSSSLASTPLAAELGFTMTAGGLTSAAALNPGTNFDTPNPGTPIFGWEQLTDVDPGAGTNNKPVGVQTNCAAGCTVAGAANQVFSALGSVDFASTGDHDYIQIVGGKATTSNLTSSVQLLGKYGAATNEGRVAEAISATDAKNYKGYVGTASRVLKAGDATQNGTVDVGDLAVLATAYNQSGKIWQTGDFTGNGTVDVGDLAVLATNYNQSGGSTSAINVVGVQDGAGAAAGSGSAVPEPASMALIGLGLLAGLGLVRRR